MWDGGEREGKFEEGVKEKGKKGRCGQLKLSYHTGKKGRGGGGKEREEVGIGKKGRGRRRGRGSRGGGEREREKGRSGLVEAS